MEFEAGDIQCSADHSLATAAFRGEDACYLVLTRTLRPGEQDTRTGLDQVHIELNDQLHLSYGGVAFGSLLPNRIELALNNRGSGNIGTTMIAVSYSLPPDRFNELRAVIRLLFNGHSHFAIAA
jgi:hypothetical protein